MSGNSPTLIRARLKKVKARINKPKVKAKLKRFKAKINVPKVKAKINPPKTNKPKAGSKSNKLYRAKK
jgi:hypothetical protein